MPIKASALIAALAADPHRFGAPTGLPLTHLAITAPTRSEIAASAVRLVAPMRTCPHCGGLYPLGNAGLPLPDLTHPRSQETTPL